MASTGPMRSSADPPLRDQGWRSELRRRVPAVLQQCGHRDAEFCRKLLEAVVGDDSEERPLTVVAGQLAAEHVAEGAALEEFLDSFSVLREILNRVLQDPTDPASAEALSCVNKEVDRALTLACSEYVKLREKTWQTLDRLWTVAHVQDLGPLCDELLRVLLGTAAAVDTAVILLVHGSELRVTAAVGLEAELEQGFKLEIGRGFSGWIAEHRAPLELSDAHTDPIVQSQVIRDRKVRALYGVPLLLGSELIGVAHIGSRTRHTFSAADKLLFGAVASRATALIARARALSDARGASETVSAVLARLNALLSAAPIGIAFLDENFRYLHINDVMARMNGLPVEAHLGRTVREAIPHLAPGLEPLLNRVVDSGEPLLEFAIERPRDEHHQHTAHLLVSFFPVVSDTGKSLGIGGLALDVTERKQALERLHQQQLEFAALADNMAQLAWMADEAGSVFWYNARWLEYTGVPLSDQTGWNWTKAHHPDHLPRIIEKVQQAIRGGQAWGETFPLRAATGEYRWFLVRVVPIHDDRGKVLRWFGTGTDITEQLAAEEALRSSKELLELVIERSGDAIIATDERGVILTFNPEAERLHGVPHQPVGCDYWATVYNLFDLEGNPLALERIPLYRALNGELVRNEHWMVKPPSGEPRVLVGTAVPLTRPDRTIAGAVLIARDETERRKHEAELRRREYEYRTLAESLPQAVWVATSDGKLQYVNGVFAKLAGVPAGDLLGSPWWNWVHPDDLPNTLAVWESAVIANQPLSVEHRLRESQGATRWFSTRAVPLRTEDEAVRFFGTSNDIQDLKAAEYDLRRRAELEQQLVGIVSHDLRSPIGAIMLGADGLLRRDDVDHRTLKAAARILSSSQRAARLIADLLDFTRARLGSGIPVDPQPMNLHLLIRQVVEESENAHPTRTIHVDSAGDGRGHWDPDRMAQVLSNLLGNALTYSPDDTPVTIRSRTDDARATIEVHNFGQPIPAQLLGHLFEHMRRGLETGRAGSRSIGLGLYIVKQIVERHSGTVDVHSDDNGTTFTVTLPRAGASSAL